MVCHQIDCRSRCDAYSLGGEIGVYEPFVEYGRARLFTNGAAADVVLMPESKFVVVLLVPENVMLPQTSKSPAVKLTLVILIGVEFETEIPYATDEVRYTPMLPAAGLSFVAVPLMPTVDVGEIRPVALIVVNAAGQAVVLQIPLGGGSKGTEHKCSRGNLCCVCASGSIRCGWNSSKCRRCRWCGASHIRDRHICKSRRGDWTGRNDRLSDA